MINNKLFKLTQNLTLCLLAVFALAPAAYAQTCAVPGRAGPGSISGVVNSYFPVTATASYSAATTTIPLGTRTGAAVAMAPGDLALVIQMQCASINSTNTSSYGDGTASTPSNGYTEPGAGTCQAGRHDIVRAGPATTNTSLDLTGSPLSGAYAVTTGAMRRSIQIVRIPQYSSVTLTGALTANAWNGTTGGIVAIDVAGTLNWNGGSVNVLGLGFRGAAGQTRSAADTTIPYRDNADTEHASKGEGIAGTPRYIHVDTNPTDTNYGTQLDNGAQGYTNGDFGKGAPGTAGGGGDYYGATRDNGGGGGGGNGGAGGFGAYGWRDAGWPAGYAGVEDLRGHGGGAFLSPSITRLVMGGGGGAGDNNNNSVGLNSSGAAGGGLVLIRAGSMTGSATILAGGARAADNPSNDGAGGGGAGGSVIIVSKTANIGSLTINADGGRGGDSFITGNVAHAGGGGGGGGIIYTNGTPSTSVAGGAPGQTNTTDNPPGGANHGATAGTSGVVGTTTYAADTEGGNTGSRCLPTLTAVKTTATPTRLFGSDTTATYTVVVSNAAARGTAYGVNILDDLPDPFTYNLASITPVYAGGATGPSTITGTGADPATVGTAGGTTANSFTIPAGGSVSVTFNVLLNAAPSSLTAYQNPVTINFADPTRLTGSTDVGGSNPSISPAGTTASGETVLGSNYDPTSSTGEDVTIQGRPLLTKSFSPTTIATTTATTLTFTIDNSMPGSIARTGIAMTDTLPTRLRVFTTPSVTRTNCGTPTITATSGATTITATGISIAAGAICTITVNVTNQATFLNSSCAANPAAFTNQASNITTLSAVVENDVVPSCLIVGNPIDLSVVKTGPTTIYSTQPITYTIVLSSVGAFSAVDAIFNDVLPANLTNVSWSCVPSGTSDCDNTTAAAISGTGNTINLTDLTLNAGAGNIITITVNATVTGSGSMTNTATITAPTTLADTNLANNTSSVTTTIQTVDLTANKSHAPANFTVGSNGTFTLTATNNGNASTVGSITIVDPVPSGLVPVSATGIGWTCTVVAQQVSCTSATVLASAATSTPITVTVHVNAASLVLINNTATVSGQYDINTANNTATDAVGIGEVTTDSFAPSNYKQAAPGSFADHPHTFTAGSSGTLDIAATVLAQNGAWTFNIYRDTNCNGVLDAGELVSPWSSLAVANGSLTCVIVRAFSPAAASGGQQQVLSVVATMTPSIGPVRSYTKTDTTIVTDPQQLVLSKLVRNITLGTGFAVNNQANPGNVLEYQLSYQNLSYAPISGLVIRDSTTYYTTFVSTPAGTTPAGLTGPTITAPGVGSTGAIIYTFGGALSPNTSGTVLFRVQVAN